MKIHPEYVYREKDLQPEHFHIANLILHMLNCILLMQIIENIFCNKTWTFSFAFFTTVLFACHPAHTEAVTGIL